MREEEIIKVNSVQWLETLVMDDSLSYKLQQHGRRSKSKDVKVLQQSINVFKGGAASPKM